MGLLVYKECCKNCLLSKNRIVSQQRAKQIIEECKKEQTHFICHKTDNVLCKTFYDKFGHYSQMVRIAERLNMVDFVEQLNKQKLISHNDIFNKKSCKT